MPIIWPASLPVAPLENGYSETMPNTTLRTSMDAGPAKVRRRTAAIPFTYTVVFLCTSEQVDALKEFVNTTLKGGSLRFEWTQPRTGETVECRFAGDQQLLKIAPTGRRWSVSFTLEVLP